MLTDSRKAAHRCKSNLSGHLRVVHTSLRLYPSSMRQDTENGKSEFQESPLGEHHFVTSQRRTICGLSFITKFNFTENSDRLASRSICTPSSIFHALEVLQSGKRPFKLYEN